MILKKKENCFFPLNYLFQVVHRFKKNSYYKCVRNLNVFEIGIFDENIASLYHNISSLFLLKCVRIYQDGGKVLIVHREGITAPCRLWSTDVIYSLQIYITLNCHKNVIKQIMKLQYIYKRLTMVCLNGGSKLDFNCVC